MNKIGKLEDIEDELGCPLDVVFKALKDGIYFSFGIKNYKEFFEPNKLFIIFSLGGFYCLSFKHFNNNFEINLKEYKKTWWLKEDLSK